MSFHTNIPARLRNITSGFLGKLDVQNDFRQQPLFFNRMPFSASFSGHSRKARFQEAVSAFQTLAQSGPLQGDHGKY
jgi:hypothetical protein